MPQRRGRNAVAGGANAISQMLAMLVQNMMASQRQKAGDERYYAQRDAESERARGFAEDDATRVRGERLSLEGIPPGLSIEETAQFIRDRNLGTLQREQGQEDRETFQGLATDFGKRGTPERTGAMALMNAGDPLAAAAYDTTSTRATMDPSMTEFGPGGEVIGGATVKQSATGLKPKPMSVGEIARAERPTPEETYDTTAARVQATEDNTPTTADGPTDDQLGVAALLSEVLVPADKIASEIEGPNGEGVPMWSIGLPDHLAARWMRSEDGVRYINALEGFVAIAVDEFITGNPTEDDIQRIRNLIVPRPGDGPEGARDKIGFRKGLMKVLEAKTGAAAPTSVLDVILQRNLDVYETVSGAGSFSRVPRQYGGR